MEKLAGMKFLEDIEKGTIGLDYPVNVSKQTFEGVWKLKKKKERKEKKIHYSALLVLLLLLGINLFFLNQEQSNQAMEMNQGKQLSWELYDK